MTWGVSRKVDEEHLFAGLKWTFGSRGCPFNEMLVFFSPTPEEVMEGYQHMMGSPYNLGLNIR